MATMEAARLPRIVRFVETTRHDGASCPHCGAIGAVIHTFYTEDNVRRGAMSGCVKLFPVSPIAAEDLRIRKKQDDYARRGWKLPSWDQEAQARIQDFYDGKLTEAAALAMVKAQKSAAASYRRRKFGR